MPGAGSAQGPCAQRCGMSDRNFRDARGMPITTAALIRESASAISAQATPAARRRIR